MADTTFSLAGQGLRIDTAEQLKEHVKPLEESTKFTHIDLSGNTFGVSACKALASLLSTQKDLISADLHDIFTTRLLNEIPEALTFLLNALLRCPQLYTIDLSDNAFGLNTVEPLVDFLSKHVPLKHLVLNNNGMGPIAGASLGNALTLLAKRKAEARTEGKEVPNLESIVCGRNRLENGSMTAWANAYEAHKSGIKSVKMIQNGIRQEGINHLLRNGLGHCKNLEVLDLQDNTFTVTGATALAEKSEEWTNLKELGLGDSYLSANGAIKVFQVLSKGNNKDVEILRLQYNDITAAGVAALLHATKTGLPNLRRVELNGNKFNEDDASIEGLAELLSERKDEHGNENDAEDQWGLDELDELEEEDSEEEDEEEGETKEEKEEIGERILKEADEEENATVSEKKDADVDNLAKVLEKTQI